MPNQITRLTNLQDYLNHLKNLDQTSFKVLDERAVLESAKSFELFIRDLTDDFSPEGRGREYLQSIENHFFARQQGVETLLRFLNKNDSLDFTRDYVICDILAGDGYVNRIINQIIDKDKCPTFINSDISYFMFKKCLERGLFSAWQNADNLFWFKSNAIDGVLLAYGTHHIPKERRSKVLKEVARVLKRGGKMVMHDFEVGSRMSAWFSDVVDRFSKTRHNYPHFEKQEMINLAKNSGFQDISIHHIEDPFIIKSNTIYDGILELTKYFKSMYGLTKINGDREKLLGLIEKYFDIHCEEINESLYEVKVVRNAIVCCATR